MFKSIFSKNQIDTLNAMYNSRTNQLLLSYEYDALFTHTNLVATSAIVLANNFNEILTLTRTGVGTYDITITNNAFVLNKTSYSVTNNHSPQAFFKMSWVNTSTLRLETYFNGTLEDRLMYRVPVKINVYK
jgi:hypothetical protein